MKFLVLLMLICIPSIVLSKGSITGDMQKLKAEIEDLEPEIITAQDKFADERLLIEQDDVICNGQHYGNFRQIAKCKATRMQRRDRAKVIVKKARAYREAAAVVEFQERQRISKEMRTQYREEQLPSGEDRGSKTMPDGTVCSKFRISDLNGKYVRTDTRCFGD